jgi:hypothetical protein
MPIAIRRFIIYLCLSLVIGSVSAYAKGHQAGIIVSAGVSISGMTVRDFTGDGHPDILTIEGPGTATSTIHLLPGNGDGTFGAAVNTNVRGNLTAVQAADFNGDGILDLAITDFGNQLTILLGDGTGAFTVKQALTTGSDPVSIALGDLNGDGKLDIVVANNLDGTISTYTGIGDGTFIAKTPQGAGFSDPVAVTVGDFNGDGKLDVAVAINTNRMSILAGNGDGTLQAPLTSIIFNEVNPSGIGAVDFNGDGKLDLIVCTLGSVLLLKGNGDLTFQNPVRLKGGLVAHDVAIADMNGDGHPDLVVSNNLGIALILNDGLGGVAATHLYNGAGNPVGLALADLNGDGKLDVAAANNLSANVHIIFGRGNGTLAGAFNQDFQIAGSFNSSGTVITADFNGDGKPDVVVENGTDHLAVLLNQGNFGLVVQPPVNVASFPGNMAAGDLNGDGKQDIVVASGGAVSVVLGNGDGTFKPPLVQAINSSSFHKVAIGDFNGDGKMDVAFTDTLNGSPTDNTVGILIGNGDGTFQPLTTILTAGELPNGLAVTDFNGDHKADLAVLNGGNGITSTVNIFLGNGDGSFTPGATLAVGAFPTDLAVADFNHDGNPDLVVVNSGNGNHGSVQVFLGTGTGNFNQSFSFTLTSPFLQSVAVGDFDADGLPDFAVTGSGGRVDIFINNTGGTFKAPVELSAGDVNVFLAAADLNNGGVPDLLASADGVLAILPNTGGTKVTSASSLNPSTFSQSVTLTASVVASVPGLPVPQGNVQFNDGATLLSSVALSNAGQAALSTSALTGGTHSISFGYGGDATFYPRALPSISQVVNKAGTSLGLAVSSIASVINQTVTFTATATPATSGTPTGDVTFFDAGSPVGFVRPLDASGKATLNISFGGAGVHSFTASYPGDQNYLTSNSTAVTETVFATPDFLFSASAANVSVRAGQSANVTLTLTPGGTFTPQITLSCSGLPSLASCSFNPPTITLTNAGASMVVTISTTAPVAALSNPTAPAGARWYLAMVVFPGFAAMFFVGGVRRRLGPKIACSLLLMLVALSGCGGSNGPPHQSQPGTPVGTSTVTVTATAGATSHQVPITLNVTP